MYASHQAKCITAEACEEGRPRVKVVPANLQSRSCEGVIEMLEHMSHKQSHNTRSCPFFLCSCPGVV